MANNTLGDLLSGILGPSNGLSLQTLKNHLYGRTGLLGTGRPQTTPLVPPRTTQFSGDLENIFHSWADAKDVPLSNDYDMQGFYLSSLMGDPRANADVNPSDGLIHFEDKFKLPNHEGFSQMSQYSKGLLDPKWIENPAPYKEGTWALFDPKEKKYKIVEIPK
jgi:hypothetical protein